MTKERWQIALHEAAHSVVGFALGGLPDGCAVTGDGRGLSRTLLLEGRRRAYVSAAGEAGELLAGRYPEPPAAEVSPLATNSPVAEVSPVVTSLAEKSFDESLAEFESGPPGVFESDDRAMALLAIAGCESEPERWAENVRHFKVTASRLVAEHEPLVVELATEVFLRGRMTGPQIHRLLTKKKGNSK
jgi:hypothetical protein